ncbi:cache domain-containing protein [Candidatus Pacearchaeota archaeon]|nr:cache domain-containing protein [Candidatus Pacearchaeota archaeon]
MRIKQKLIIASLALTIIPLLVLGIFSFNLVSSSVDGNVEEKLIDQSKSWKLLVESYNSEIEAQEIAARQTANDIVTAQAKATYELIEKSLDDGGRVLSSSESADVLTRMSHHTVGETGYIWVLDYEGNYILSLDQLRDGDNIWMAKDFDGNYLVQDLVNKGKAVQGSEIAYHSYWWANEGEEVPREKIAAMIHFPELEWVVGISTYYDDLVDMNYRETTMESVKNLVAQQQVGATGYIWVVDSDGVYQVSKDRLRDGEDINEAKDADGVLFIQEAVKKAKAAGDDADLQKYPWKNIGENTARLKIAGVSYVSEWDWIIGVSAYYDDFEETREIAKAVIILILLTMLISGIVSFMIAIRISKPLTRLKGVADEITKGNLDVEMPEIKTKDEIYDLNEGIKGILAAVEFLTGEVEKANPSKKGGKKSK